jgi:hypothetical protein
MSDPIARLGRRYEPDDRDQRFQLSAVLPQALVNFRYWWDNSVFLDQGSSSTCVGNAWAHRIADSPKVVSGVDEVYARRVYREATLLDQWPDNDHDDYDQGTSVRAGAKALKNDGKLSTYRWCWDLDTLIQAVLANGPVVLGTNWYASMFSPKPVKDAEGTYRKTLVIAPGAQVAGGHAYVVNGVSVPAKVFRMKNSWSKSWGANGRASIGFDTMARLLSEQGEACAPTEA